MRRIGFLIWRALVWNAAGFLVLCVVALVSAWCLCGCGAAQLEVLAAMTETADAAMPTLDAQVAADLEACGRLDYAKAKSCIDAAEEKWSPALAAGHALLALDDSALAGSVQFEEARATYCSLRKALPEMPGSLLGVELCP